MFYLIQKNVFKFEHYDVIFEALNRLGLEYEVVDCPPFTDRLEFNTTRKDVFCFGSVKMAGQAVKEGWYPGSFYGGNHDFLAYKDEYKDNLLNYDSEICGFAEPLDFTRYIDRALFIRPCKDSKVFNGAVYSKMKWEDLVYNSLTNGHVTILTPDTPIQVSEVKVVYREIRVWIVDGKVVTASYYRYHTNSVFFEEVEPEALEFAQRMVDIYQVAEAFVMDVCYTPDGWKIVEINCINCSGFYKGDMQKVIMALEAKFNV